MKASIALLFLILFIDVDAHQFRCPAPFGFYKHKTCWKYWVCSNWYPYAMICPFGTQWNQSTLSCNHLTDCQRHNFYPTKRPTTPEPSTTERSSTPTTKPSTTERSITEEPSTLTTEPSTTEPSSIATTEVITEEPFTSTIAHTEHSTTEKSSISTTYDYSNNTVFKCPEASGYYEHRDCWKYWQCFHFNAIVLECQKGTQWSQRNKLCVELTDCKRPDDKKISIPCGESTEESSSEETSTILKSTSDYDEDDDDETDEDKKNNDDDQTDEDKKNDEDEQTDEDKKNNENEDTTPSDRFKCPESSGYYEHKDCWKFWQCGNGIAYEMDCPEGTQWDQSILTCNHRSDCERPNSYRSSTDDSSSEETSTILKSTSDYDEDDDDETNEDKKNDEDEQTDEDKKNNENEDTTPSDRFKCPESSGYYEHKDCWKFWQCGNGIAYEMDCPEGTQWDQSILTCNHRSDCERPNSYRSSTDDSSSEETSTILKSTYNYDENDYDDQTEEDKENNYDDQTEEDKKNNYDDQTDEDKENNENEDTTHSNRFKCPEPFGYYEHKDCWKYWQCGNGIAYVMACPVGTQWDQRILQCNHLSDCDRSK